MEYVEDVDVPPLEVLGRGEVTTRLVSTPRRSGDDV